MSSYNASKKEPSTSHPRVSATCSFESDDGGDADEDFNDASFDQLDSSFSDKRQSRNQNEKKRRDQFNNFIQELGNLLTHPRKIDKATILKESLNFFKNHEDKPQDNNEIDAKFKPPFLQNDEFLRFMIEFQNAFCLVFDLNGQIKYVSDDIIHLMGHFPKAIENRSIYKLVDEKSALQLKNFLKRKFSSADVIDFECKFKRNGIGQNNPSYELVKIKGFFKRTNSSEHFNTLVKLDSFMRINEIYATEINPKSFESELSVDLKFTSLSPAASEVIGYSPIEVLGASLYDYCHHDDLDKLVDCHKNLLANGKTSNSRDQLNYRFRTKGQQWIWLRTAFELVYDAVKKRPSSILCNNQTINIDTSSQDADPSSASSNSNNTGQSSFEDELSKQGVTPEDLSYEKPSSTSSSSYDKQPSSSSSTTYDKSVSNKQDLRRYGTDDQNETSTSFKSPDVTRQSSSQSSSLYEPKKSSSKNEEEESEESVVTSKPNKQLDEGMATFLESCTNSSYRSFVLEQFQKKKFSIVSAIQDRQDELSKLKDELKVIEDTVENIIDEKKLKSWLMEFHNQKALLQNANAATGQNPDNNSKNAKRRMLDSANNQEANALSSSSNYNNMGYDQSSSPYSTEKPTTSSHVQDFSNNQQQDNNNIQLGSYFRSTQMEPSSYNLFAKQPVGFLPDSSKSGGIVGGGDPNARIKKINLSKRGGGTHITAPPESSFNNLMNNNEELTTSRLVGDLISLRSSLPPGSAGMSYSTDQPDYPSLPTSSAATNSAPNMNFDMEVIDRLFYKHPSNRKTDTTN